MIYNVYGKVLLQLKLNVLLGLSALKRDLLCQL